MKGLLAFVLGALLCVSAVFSVAAEEASDPGHVVVLTTENFDEVVNNAEIILVEFYAPWCGHCKRLEPEYKAAAETLKNDGSNIILAKVDATEHGDLAARFGVNGYPTMKVFRKGVPSEYGGPRDAKGIVRYMEKQAGPASRPLTSAEQVDTFVAKAGSDGVVFVAFFDDADSKELAAFRDAANTLRDEFSFAEVVGAELGSKYNHNNKVVAYKAHDDKEAEFPGTFDAAAFPNWANSQAIALAGEITAENKKRYEATGLPLVSVYFDVDHEKNVKRTQYYLRRIEQAAKDFAGKVLFGIAHNRLAGDLRGTGTETVILSDTKSGQVYKYTGASFTVDGLKAFAQDFLDKKLKPFLKSEPVPEDNSGPVKVVVGENFQELVLDNPDDVLVEFYAPWCGHCKNLAPEWEKLGTELADVESVTIAKIDATANDFPKDKFPVSGYPTIFFKSGSGEIKKYEGGRSVNDFVKFLEANATTKFSKSKSEDSEEKDDKKEKKDKKKKDKKEKKDKKKKDKKNKDEL